MIRLIAGFILLGLLMGCGGGREPIVLGTAVPPMPTLAPDQIRQGKTVYAQHCAACHGTALEGQPDWKIANADGSYKAPPHDATGHTWHHGDPTLLESVQLGGARLVEMGIADATSAMPAYADILSADEITAVLTYIKSQWPAEIQKSQWEATLREQAQQP